MTCFFQTTLNRDMFLNRGYVLKIEGVFKMTVSPHAGGTVPYPNEHGREGHCQRLEFNVRKAIGAF